MHRLTFNSGNPEFTEFELKVLEQRLEVTLPQSYIDLMRASNGGYLEENLCIALQNPIPKNMDYYLGDRYWPLSTVAGVTTDQTNINSLLYTADTAWHWDVPKKLVAFDGDGHTWLAFDYRNINDSEPKIVFIESDDFTIYDIAKNFEEMLKILVPESEACPE